MSTSKLDAVYRSILLTKFFTKGWGKPENLRRLFEFRKVVSNRDECFKLVERDYPVTITKEQNLSDCKLLEGYFVTPLERYLPGIVPKIAQKAHFQALLPVHWPEKGAKPVCLHLAGTGDHFFWRRRNLMVKPLIKEAGIGGIILENPFYGLRKPTDQVRSSLHNVSDIFVMGGCLILEALVMFHWCERNGLGPLGVTGLSMGGHMASLAATNWPKPLVLVPCLSWSTASAVFLQGVMSQSINWDLLEDQYLSDGIYREKLSKMVTIVDEAFLAGKKFARTYSQYPLNIENNAQSNRDIKNVDITYKEKDAQVKEVTSLRQEPFELKTATVSPSEQPITENLVNRPLEVTATSAILSKTEHQLPESKIITATQENDIASDVQISERNASEEQKSERNPSDEEKSKITDVEKSKLKEKSWNLADITSDWIQLPFIKPSSRKIDISKIHWRDREALQFMRGIMDECTHLSNFSVPFDTSLIIAVCAKHDAYVPRDDVGTLEEIWPGAEVRYVDAGHVSAYILHQSLFRACIKEAFERSKKRWKDGKHID